MSGITTTEVRFTDLHAFERDLLFTVSALERQLENPPKGLAIKAEIEADYETEINNSRLYQNLDGLIDQGLLTKSKRDGRTNEYATTEEARDLLERRTERRAGALGLTGGTE